jgi:hypothetical protein
MAARLMIDDNRVRLTEMWAEAVALRDSGVLIHPDRIRRNAEIIEAIEEQWRLLQKDAAELDGEAEQLIRTWPWVTSPM